MIFLISPFSASLLYFSPESIFSRESISDDLFATVISSLFTLSCSPASTSLSLSISASRSASFRRASSSAFQLACLSDACLSFSVSRSLWLVSRSCSRRRSSEWDHSSSVERALIRLSASLRRVARLTYSVSRVYRYSSDS